MYINSAHLYSTQQKSLGNARNQEQKVHTHVIHTNGTGTHAQNSADNSREHSILPQQLHKFEQTQTFTETDQQTVGQGQTPQLINILGDGAMQTETYPHNVKTKTSPKNQHKVQIQEKTIQKIEIVKQDEGHQRMSETRHLQLSQEIEGASSSPGSPMGEIEQQQQQDQHHTLNNVQSETQKKDQDVLVDLKQMSFSLAELPLYPEQNQQYLTQNVENFNQFQQHQYQQQSPRRLLQNKSNNQSNQRSQGISAQIVSPIDIDKNIQNIVQDQYEMLIDSQMIDVTIPSAERVNGKLRKNSGDNTMNQTPFENQQIESALSRNHSNLPSPRGGLIQPFDPSINHQQLEAQFTSEDPSTMYQTPFKQRSNSVQPGNQISQIIQSARQEQKLYHSPSIQRKYFPPEVFPTHSLTEKKKSYPLVHKNPELIEAKQQPCMTSAVHCPQSLYFTSNHGEVPRLADLRDAIRKQKFSHQSYNSTMKTASVQRQLNHDGAMNVDGPNYDPVLEEQPLHEYLTPGHIQMIDYQMAQINMRSRSRIRTSLTKAEQDDMTNRLIKTNNEKLQQLKQQAFDLAKAESKPSFKAMANPFDKNKKIEAAEDLACLNPGLKKYLHEFDEMVDRERMKLPAQLISFPKKMVRRVIKIEREETLKRKGPLNDNAKFTQLQAYVHSMLEKGHSFKEMAKQEAKEARERKRKERRKSKSPKQSTEKLTVMSEAGKRRQSMVSNSNLSNIDVQSVAAMSAPVQQDSTLKLNKLASFSPQPHHGAIQSQMELKYSSVPKMKFKKMQFQLPDHVLESSIPSHQRISKAEIPATIVRDNSTMESSQPAINTSVQQGGNLKNVGMPWYQSSVVGSQQQDQNNVGKESNNSPMPWYQQSMASQNDNKTPQNKNENNVGTRASPLPWFQQSLASAGRMGTSGALSSNIADDANASMDPLRHPPNTSVQIAPQTAVGGTSIVEVIKEDALTENVKGGVKPQQSDSQNEIKNIQLKKNKAFIPNAKQKRKQAAQFFDQSIKQRNESLLDKACAKDPTLLEFLIDQQFDKLNNEDGGFELLNQNSEVDMGINNSQINQNQTNDLTDEAIQPADLINSHINHQNNNNGDQTSKRRQSQMSKSLVPGDNSRISKRTQSTSQKLQKIDQEFNNLDMKFDASVNTQLLSEAMVNASDENVQSILTDLEYWYQTIDWLQDDLSLDDEPKSFKYAFDKLAIDRETEASCLETANILNVKTAQDLRQIIRIVRANNKSKQKQKFKLQPFNLNQDLLKWLCVRSPYFREQFRSQKS